VEAIEYARMAEADDRMWWYRGLHRHIITTLRRARLPARFRLLDAGCGTGGLLLALRRAFPAAELSGVERHPDGLAHARARTGLPVTEGDLHALPLPDASVDAVTVTDVLYHQGIEPARALTEIARVLRPGGVFVSNEVAFPWLRSYHDEQVHAARRFTRASFSALLRHAGLEPTWTSYWNFFLLPVLVIKRKVLRPRPGESDVHAYPAWLDRSFGALLALENLGLRAGLRWPAGSSLLTLAQKPDVPR
jgi:SAM-dependent methyltransferase